MFRIIIAVAFALALNLPGEARATLFSFSFGTNAAGTFETGADSIADPGYYLVTALTITSFNGEAVDVRATDFMPGAAFNPATGAFLNHYAGDTYDDIGGVALTGTIAGNTVYSLDPLSFGWVPNYGLSITTSGGSLYANGTLVITRAPTAVVEPVGLVLLATGLLGLVASRARRPSGSRAITGYSF